MSLVARTDLREGADALRAACDQVYKFADAVRLALPVKRRGRNTAAGLVHLGLQGLEGALHRLGDRARDGGRRRGGGFGYASR